MVALFLMYVWEENVYELCLISQEVATYVQENVDNWN